MSYWTSLEDGEWAEPSELPIHCTTATMTTTLLSVCKTIMKSWNNSIDWKTINKHIQHWATEINKQHAMLFLTNRQFLKYKPQTCGQALLTQHTKQSESIIHWATFEILTRQIVLSVRV